MHDIQIIVGNDRTNAFGVDVILSGNFTTIANEDCTGDFLIELDTHFTHQEVHHGELSDVEHVITVHLLLLVDGGRRGLTLVRRDHFIELAMIVITIKREALSTSLIRSQVDVLGLDASPRNLMDAIQKTGHPLGVALVQIGLGTLSTGIREEHVDVLNTVILGVLKHELLKRARRITLGGSEEVLLSMGEISSALHTFRMHKALIIIRVLERRSAFDSIVFEDIHFISFIRRLFDGLLFIGLFALGLGRFGLTLIQSHTDKTFNKRLLLIIQTVVDLLRILVIRFRIGIVRISFFGFCGLFGRTVGSWFILFLVLLRIFICVKHFIQRIFREYLRRISRLVTLFDLAQEIGADRGRILKRVTIIRMTNHIINSRLWVSPSKDQRHFTDLTMKHIGSFLDYLISGNGQRHHIAMLNDATSSLTGIGIVQIAIRIDAIITVFQQCLTDHRKRTSMIMLEHQRNHGAILIGKCVFTNDSAIGAKNIVLCSVATEITLKAISHMDHSFLELMLFLRSRLFLRLNSFGHRSIGIEFINFTIQSLRIIRTSLLRKLDILLLEISFRSSIVFAQSCDLALNLLTERLLLFRSELFHLQLQLTNLISHFH
nr:MAG TPA: hypothetical protein [Caudoviricetes sp.]